MREIKFKTYIKDTSDNTISFAIWDVANDRNPCNEEAMRLLPKNSVHISGLMQYTGLKDKHGKEIYEGDIIQNAHQKLSRKGSVYFKDGAFRWSFDDLPLIHYEDGHLINYDWCEIIGNIYENPELIK